LDKSEKPFDICKISLAEPKVSFAKPKISPAKDKVSFAKGKISLLKTSRHLLNTKNPLLNPNNRWINAKNPWINPVQQRLFPKLQMQKRSACSRLCVEMKVCGYCGAKNDDSALRCGACGSPFPADSPNKESGSSVTSPLASELATGFGILLLMLALFFGVGWIFMQVLILQGKGPKDSGIYSRIYSPTLSVSLTPAPFIALAAVYPTFALIRARFGRSRAIRATIVISLLTCALSVLPLVEPVALLIWCFPAILLGMALGSLGFIFGIPLQMAFGVLLLIRFRSWRSQEGNPGYSQSAA
jgi:hypothetical protein